MFLPNGTGIFYIDVYMEDRLVVTKCDFDDIVSAYESGALLVVRDFRSPNNMVFMYLSDTEDKHHFYFNGFLHMETLMFSEWGVTILT